VTVPEQRIGYKGPGCFGIIGLLVLALAIVLGFSIWIGIALFFHSDTTGNTGDSGFCNVIQHVNGPPTEKCTSVP
jgi:hypothetical protein